MEFQVRKGLETPLKVHGMNTRFFLFIVLFWLSWFCLLWGF